MPTVLPPTLPAAPPDPSRLLEREDTMALVRRAQAGDRRALGEILRRYEPRLRRMASRRLGQRLRRHGGSLDLLQEALVQVVRSFPTFHIPSEDALIRTLATLIRNRIRDWNRRTKAQRRDYRRLQRLEGPPDDSQGGDALDLAASGPTPGSQVHQREELAVLRASIDELPEKHRRVVRLHLEGRSWGDIARETGSPSADAARMLLERAKIKLKRIYTRRLRG